MADIRVGGLQRLSACDWPGELVATVFLQGCPWDCPYCHNPHLIPVKGNKMLDWDAVLGFLAARRGLLDGVVFSGGEPTLQRALDEAAVKRMGAELAALGVATHTLQEFRLAGTRPNRPVHE